MKIAHLVTIFPPYKSGMGNVCYQQVVELAKLGHQVTVLTPNYGESRIFSEPIHNSIFNIQYSRPLLKYGNAAFVPSIIKDLNNFDIIHLHYPFIGAAEALLFSAKGGSASGGKKTLVIQYHMDLGLPRFCSFLTNGYNSIITKNIFKRADKILVSSYDYAENSRLIGDFFKKNKEKFIELPYGVDTNRFKPEMKNKNLLKKLELDDDEKIILFVGGLDRAHYFKGIDVLLRAISNLKSQISNLNLIIVGRGNQKIKYERLAKKLEIKNKVIFADDVDNQDLPDYYNLADIFVLPSINCLESFGIVLIEAMACGKPCIASNLPGVRTVVDDTETGFLIKPDDIDDLTEKIRNLLENEILAKEMGKSGRKKVEKKYDQNKINKELEKIYVSLSKN